MLFSGYNVCVILSRLCDIYPSKTDAILYCRHDTLTFSWKNNSENEALLTKKESKSWRYVFCAEKILKWSIACICDLAITDIFWHEHGCLHEIFISISSSIYLRLWYFGSCQLQRLFPKMLLVISAPSTHPPHSCVCCAVCTCQAAYHTCRPEEIKLGRNTRATPYQEKLTKLYHRDNENMKLFG